MDKIYRDNNKEAKAKLDHEYYLNNTETIKNKASEWYLDNKFNKEFKIFKSCNNRMIKCDIDVQYRGRENILEYFDCTVEHYIKWIEFNFDNNMTWENHGIYWHFDHLIPCSSFNFNDLSHIYKCFHWTNIRPLTGVDNMIKSNNITIDVVNKHYIIIDKFIKFNSIPNNNGNVIVAEDN
jgi:hypothetical protein